MRLLRSVIVVVAFISLIGCGQSGPKLVSVKGTVTYQGKPVSKASINIVPLKGMAATAETDDKGSFTAQTNGKPGVVVGKAKVMVTCVKMIGDPGPNDGTPEAAAEFSRKVNSGEIRYESSVPAKYGHSTTTPLEIIVTADASKNDFPIELTD
jgi:hypothetical protein